MAFSLDKSVVLVGMPGAGKSTVGRKLADRLGLDFVDCDDEISATEGLTVADIFARLGEPHFRACERRTMARLVGGPPRVIAAGGGAFLDADIRERVLENCIAVWLDAEVHVLADRVAGSADRPLLDHGCTAARLAELSEQRRPAYAQAHVRIRMSTILPVESLVERVAHALMAPPA